MGLILIITAGIGLAFIVWLKFKRKNQPPLSGKSYPVSHHLLTAVLQKYVSNNGAVQYKKLLANRNELDDYLNLLRASHPNNSWPHAEQLVYWINAYNAFTLELILNNYPVKSIRDTGGLLNIPGLQSPWDIKFINIENREYSLGHIEHEILRKEFKDARIHFAINCASQSCPKLLNKAFTADEIEQQLNTAAKDFLNDESKNKIDSHEVKLSKIFDWYKGDFTTEGTVIHYINKYAPVQVNDNASLSYLEYDWSLNEKDEITESTGR